MKDLVVMGQMSIHGVLSRVEQLGDRLRVIMNAGARQVLIPIEPSPSPAGTIFLDGPTLHARLSR